jgi:adenylate cyclase
MALLETLTETIEETLNIKWDSRNGNVIPTSDDIALKDGAVEMEATFLYADLAGSSLLAKHCPWDTTAKIIRAYLNCCTRAILANNGEIRSFDGDRVMGVFKGASQNTSAVKCARQIFYSVENILNPFAKKKFQSIRDHNVIIKNCIGIDTGEARAVRAGVRNNNDLIWIGKAPSFAAKLSDVREYPYSVFISQKVYEMMHESVKFYNGNDVWENRNFEFAEQKHNIYRTKFMYLPS